MWLEGEGAGCVSYVSENPTEWEPLVPRESEELARGRGEHGGGAEDDDDYYDGDHGVGASVGLGAVVEDLDVDEACFC